MPSICVCVLVRDQQPTKKFRIYPRVSYTLTEIQDSSSGLLHPHRNSGFLLGSLTPSQKFRIFPRVSYTLTEIFGMSPRVSYTHTDISDNTTGLLHQHRNFGFLHGSLTPTQDLSDTTAGLLHPNSRLLTLGD